jgi:hypothetical protein
MIRNCRDILDLAMKRSVGYTRRKRTWVLSVVLICGLPFTSAVAAGPVDQSFFGNTPFGSQQLILTIGGTTVTLNATDTGWYDSTGRHNAANKTYFVGNTALSCVGGVQDSDPFFIITSSLTYLELPGRSQILN